MSVNGCLPCPEYFVQAAALGISCVAEGIQQNPTDGEWHHVVEDSAGNSGPWVRSMIVVLIS